MILDRGSIFALLLNAGKQRKRISGSAQLTEFSAALVLLIIGIVLPLLDLSILPLHWILTQEIVTSEARRLAQSKNFSSAIDALATDSSLNTQLANIGGVKLLSSQCVLVITMLNDPYETFVAGEPNSILPEWLPNGKRSPCSYELEVDSTLELSPLILFRNSFIKDVPGLTRPFTCTIKERAHWENYSRNPATKKFYMNE